MSANNPESLGSKIKKIGESSSLAKSIGGRKHGRGIPVQSEGIFSQTGAQGDAGGFPQNFPEQFPVANYGDVGAVIIDIDLVAFFSHFTRMRLVGNPTITISHPPGYSKSMVFFVEVTQDGVGGRSIIWPVGMLPTPVIKTTPNSKTLIMIFTADQGATYHTQIIGSSSGGGSGEVFTWSNNHSAAEFNLTNLNEINFKSTLNSLSIKRSGTAPGYNTLEYDSVQAHDFYVNRSFTIIPRFGITETSLQSNVKLVMNDKEIQQARTVELGSLGSVLPGTKEIVGTADGLVMNITASKKFRIVAGNDPTNRLLEIDDLTKSLATYNMHMIVKSGKIFTVEDVVTSRSIQMYNLFGEQFIAATDALRLQVGLTDRVKIDTRFRLTTGTDFDAADNDIANVKTLQIKELIPAGSAPTGITDVAILFCRPSGTGKTELRVKFATGTSILLAQEV